MFANHRRGLSLIEMLIYLTILAVVALTLTNLLLISSRSFTRSKIDRNLMTSGMIVLERLVREVQLATNVDLTGSTLGVSPGRLKLNTTDAGGAAATVSFAVSGGVLTIEEGALAPTGMTPNTVTVSSLIFRRVATANSQAVKVDLTLIDSRVSPPRVENFYTTAILRGSY